MLNKPPLKNGGAVYGRLYTVLGRLRQNDYHELKTDLCVLCFTEYYKLRLEGEIANKRQEKGGLEKWLRG